MQDGAHKYSEELTGGPPGLALAPLEVGSVTGVSELHSGHGIVVCLTKTADLPTW